MTVYVSLMHAIIFQPQFSSPCFIQFNLIEEDIEQWYIFLRIYSQKIEKHLVEKAALLNNNKLCILVKLSLTSADICVVDIWIFCMC